MARPLRIELAGGLFQVTARGDRREAIYFGDADADRMRARLPQGDLSEVPPAQKRSAPPPLSSFTAMGDRHAGMAAAYRTGGYLMKAIGEAFGVHYATVSRAVRRAEVSDRKT